MRRERGALSQVRFYDTDVANSVSLIIVVSEKKLHIFSNIQCPTDDEKLLSWLRLDS